MQNYQSVCGANEADICFAVRKLIGHHFWYRKFGESCLDGAVNANVQHAAWCQPEEIHIFRFTVALNGQLVRSMRRVGKSVGQRLTSQCSEFFGQRN